MRGATAEEVEREGLMSRGEGGSGTRQDFLLCVFQYFGAMDFLFDSLEFPLLIVEIRAMMNRNEMENLNLTQRFVYQCTVHLSTQHSLTLYPKMILVILWPSGRSGMFVSHWQDREERGQKVCFSPEIPETGYETKQVISYIVPAGTVSELFLHVFLSENKNVAIKSQERHATFNA